MSSNISNKVYDNLKTLLTPLQTELGIRFYQNNAPESAKSPYIVFRIEDMMDTSPSYNLTLKFMVWDERDTSSKKSLELSDSLLSHFNKGQYVFEGMAFHSTLLLQQNIPSEYLADKQCIEQQYNLHIYV